MKRFTAWSLVLLMGVAGVAAGFWLGVRAGADLGLMLDSAPKGSIAVIHLQALEAGKTKNMATMLESDVDNALLWNRALEKDALYPLLQPLWGFDTSSLPKYLTRIADYRFQHASPFTPEALAEPAPRDEKEREFRAWLIEGARENQQTISGMVARYASKPNVTK